MERFNTGRSYTEEGQRIAFEVIERESDAYGYAWRWEWRGEDTPRDEAKTLVMFADLDRGIQGVVQLSTVNERTVLHAYDHGAYASCGWDEAKFLYDYAKEA